MAQVANTFETYDAVGNREELANTIHMLTPEETPFLSLIGRKGIKTIHPEWQTFRVVVPVSATPAGWRRRSEGPFSRPFPPQPHPASQQGIRQVSTEQAAERRPAECGRAGLRWGPQERAAPRG